MSLPKIIHDELNLVAQELLQELNTSRLHVVLVPAPEQRFEGHMIRLAIEKNPRWWQDLYASYRPKKLDKKGFKEALERFMEKGPGKSLYDNMVYENIVARAEEEYGMEYFITGVPF